MRRLFGTRRGELLRRSFRAQPAILPLVGPYESNSPILISSLSDLTLNAPMVVNSSQTQTNPLMYKTLSLTSSGYIVPDYTTTNAIFIWADVVSVIPRVDCICSPPSFDVSGRNGTDASISAAGTGGDGATGGGGGGAIPIIVAGSYEPQLGGTGGEAPPCTDPDGDPGQPQGCESPLGGSGGNGHRILYSYTGYGTGGSGGKGGGDPFSCGSIFADGGAGYFGYGGGGGGGTVTTSGCNASDLLGGGGGGGAGLVVIVCNQLLLGDAGPAYLQATGGNGGIGYGGDNVNSFSEAGGGGGGGSIWIATKKYTASTFSASVAGGVATASCGDPFPPSNGNAGVTKIYKINHNSTLGSLSDFNSSWNNT